MFAASYLTIQLTTIYHILALALDRVVAIKIPIWHRNILAANSLKTVRITTITIFIFCFLCSAPRFFFFVKHPDGACGVSESRMNSAILKYLVGFSTFGSILLTPHVFYIIANTIFVRLLKRRQKTKEIAASATTTTTITGTTKTNAVFSRNVTEADMTKNDNNNRKQQNHRSYVIMLFMLTFGCSVAAGAAGAINILTFAIGEKTEAEMLSFDIGRTGFARFAWSLVDILGVLKNSMNFIFYMLSGDEFRKAFRKALGLGGQESNSSKITSGKK